MAVLCFGMAPEGKSSYSFRHLFISATKVGPSRQHANPLPWCRHANNVIVSLIQVHRQSNGTATIFNWLSESAGERVLG